MPKKAYLIHKALVENSDVLENLNRLRDQAEEFNLGHSDYDVIKEYFKSTVDCKELVSYIKVLESTDNELAVALVEALCHILIRIASDLNMYMTAGMCIVKAVLAFGMKTVLSFLGMKENVSRIKQALYLLSSMIVLGSQSAIQVVSHLDFNHKTFKNMVDNTNSDEEEDVRTSFLNFIVLAISKTNNDLIRKIVEVKDLLKRIFSGLVSDRPSTITQVLNAFQQHIVENDSIPITSKKHLFDDYSVTPLIELCSWKGPTEKGKLGEDLPQPYKASFEEISEVISSTHNFILAFCRALRHGIDQDAMISLFRKNRHHMTTKILTSFPTPYTCPRTSSFVVKVLQVCPDQLIFYMPTLKDSFAPKLSPVWLNLVNFLKQIMESLYPISAIFKCESDKQITQSVMLAKTFCMFDVLDLRELNDVLSNEDRILCFYLCDFLLSVLKQVKKIAADENINSSPLSDNTSLMSFQQSFLSSVFKNLPTIDVFLVYFEKIINEGARDSPLDNRSIEEDHSEGDLNLDINGKEDKDMDEDILEDMDEDEDETDDDDMDEEIDEDEKDKMSSKKRKLQNIHAKKKSKSAQSPKKRKMADVPMPDLSEELHVVLEILKIYKELFEKLKRNFNLILDKILTVKECNSLSYVKLINIYSTIIDLLSSHDLATMWSKEDSSPLRIVLEVYRKAHKSKQLSGARELIHKILLKTKIFDSCEWEIDMWLDAVESADTKDVLHIFDYITEVVVQAILESPNKEVCLDGDYHKNYVENQGFSDFVPTALEVLNSLEENRTKGCHLFLEQALISIIQHQSSAKNIVGVIKPYKILIRPNLFSYWKLLASSKEPRHMYKFCKTVLKSSDPSKSDIELLLMVFEVWNNLEEKTTPTEEILQLALYWLNFALEGDFKLMGLVVFLKNMLESADSFNLENLIDYDDFVPKVINKAYVSQEVGSLLWKIFALMCEKFSAPVEFIHKMVTEHSNFLKVMLQRGDSKRDDSKDNLVDMLIVLTKRDSTLCEKIDFGLLLASYKGTLNAVDQKLLFLIKLFSDSGIDMSPYSPFLWGAAAIQKYSLLNNPEQRQRPQAKDVLKKFSPEKIESTVLHYPFEATLTPTLELIEVEEGLCDNIYDLRFFLPHVAQLLLQGTINDIGQSGILKLVFASLSSTDSSTRAAGYYCLKQYYQRLDNCKRNIASIWVHLINSLRNSINDRSNPKLPTIITIFLARTVDILMKPGDDNYMYDIISNFFVKKPALEIDQVPEYYTLFNSIDVHNREERLFLLKLLAEGMKTPLDFHICQKRYIFNTLMVHFDSSISDPSEKMVILDILSAAVRMESCSYALCKTGFLMWLHNVVKRSDSMSHNIFKKLCFLLKDLSKTTKENSNFLVILLSLLRSTTSLLSRRYVAVEMYISLLRETLNRVAALDDASHFRPRLSLQNIANLQKLQQVLHERLHDSNCKISTDSSDHLNKCLSLLAEILSSYASEKRTQE